MADAGDHDIRSRTENTTRYRSRNTNYIGDGAQISTAIQIAGSHYGGLDLRDLPNSRTSQTTPSPEPQTKPVSDATVQQVVDLLWHLARVDPKKRAEAMAAIDALEAGTKAA
ncbi:hypothetical protein [Streptomyces sp. NPDC048172]|uniref:hypothetical protein n=1 Tax=Streptomyces sp. NPDC048172 TaxID=3365505 RepID=UPI00371DB693